MAPPKLSVFLLLSSIFLFSNFAHGVLDKKLIRKLNKFGKSDVLVNFAGENFQVIENINSRSFRNRISRVQALCAGLHALTEFVQDPVIKFLQSFGVKYQSFWASNQLVIRNANLFLIQGVDAFPQVSRIQVLPTVKLSPRPSSITPAANTTIQWGVAKIQADQVWSTYGTTGEGVVVANIDTGVRGTHEALAGNFRSDHGWYDPYTNTTTPTDGNGLSIGITLASKLVATNTKQFPGGTICGQNGIGVAPGATWIACRGCGSSSCDAAQLLGCGQWMLSPTNPDGSDPDPTKIPDVVSNSWGSNIGGDNWYNATIEAWKAAGILHAFAIGNSGPACRSGGSPGDQPTTFSVGSTDSNDRLSIFSSKGPAGTYPATFIKPDISAPGSNVYSAWNTADNAYNTISGTSMATPHVAGTIALMISANNNKQQNGTSTTAKLTMDDVVTYIQKTADTQNLTVPFPNYRCELSLGKMKFPNNQFGSGRVNALNAVGVVVNGLPSNSTV